MTLLQSIFLGLLQGLTEFLPVSSSGHLILAQKLFGIQADLFFDVMLHVATLFAVLIAYRKSVWETVRHPIRCRKAMLIAAASLPTFAIAFVIGFFLPENVLSGVLLPIGFAISAVLIVLSQVFYKPTVRFGELPLWKAVICGTVQGIAVIPGLSRSGSTVSALKLLGTEQKDAAEFSFLLSIPVILASAAVETLRVTEFAVPWHLTVVGMLFAFFSGYAAIYTVNKVLKKNGWTFFAVYLAIPFAVSLITL